ncbi:cyanophycinase [Hymenobacter taeanensis]|uniref:Cyanophycinase n=1 Tax=Hymenobacter taeanensis TaxID=2735321 RepID=A0A6M6BI92_9BACT|nr:MULTISPECIES: cyanophycinase [Hymenobacter]QJX47023.1 cyanophycinase [Hymenobacter taeanensis]UOQ80901.1 cyanophycinase [Hymenobacter sp. 5414T-23]
MPHSSVLPLGTLVALGGGDDDAMLALLCDLLPSSDTPVEIITVASRDASRAAGAYEKALRDLGCRNARHLPINEHYRADAPAALRRIRRAGLVFFSGGDQERITDFLHNTEFLQVLRERYQQDATFIVAGTSAGAAALPDSMLVEGYGWRAVRKGGIETKAGLGLLPRLLIDQHFIERGRFGRLAHALTAHSMCLGLGLSEETGVIIRGGQEVEVFGDGVVVMIDGCHTKGSNLGQIGRGEPISVQNLRVNLLVAGQRLNLKTREVLADNAPVSRREEAPQ